MSPNEVNSSNEQHLLDTVYNYKRTIVTKGPKRRRAAYKIGDYVRISKFRKLFDKGYTANWTTEIFKIKKVLYHTDPITYLLVDYQDKEVEGCFYPEEIQPVANPNVYLIERTIRKQKGREYVQWLGFGNEHNSWIPTKNVI